MWKVPLLALAGFKDCAELLHGAPEDLGLMGLGLLDRVPETKSCVGFLVMGSDGFRRGSGVWSVPLVC